jgi:hypothetical protein
VLDHLLVAERLTFDLALVCGPEGQATYDASNLAEAINFLQSDVRGRDEFNRVLHSILPDVHAVSTYPCGNDNLEMKVWTVPPRSKRGDLAVPLRDSVDEPQSFLHPGTARKLRDVLGDYSQHQYIIGTHSPALISPATDREGKRRASAQGLTQT